MPSAPMRIARARLFIAAERDAALGCSATSPHQLRVDVRPAHLVDVDEALAAGQLARAPA